MKNENLQFLRELRDQIRLQIYLSLIVIFFFILLTHPYKITKKEFEAKLKDITGQDYANFQLDAQVRSKLAKKYHTLCTLYNLNRDFSTDYLILGILTKYKIKNTSTLTQGKNGTFYFTYKGLNIPFKVS